MGRPCLTFFCELETDALQALFAERAVMDDLAALGASISLGILDLSPERALVVRRLNQADIPVIAWQLLPKSQGYWYNARNASQATARYLAFKAWTAEHALHWTGIGIDIELDIREIQQLLLNKWRLLPTILRRTFDSERLRRAQAEYSALIQQMRADGYRVDSYLLPWMLDERAAGSTLLQRIGGLVDVPTDREVPMLYTSFMRPYGPGMVWSYAQDVQSVGLGSTGGGVYLEGMPDIRPLDWNEFSRDLRLARRWINDIHVFSLEGCVQQGFLARLKDFDWDQPITPPLEMAEQVERFRKMLRLGLWASAHPFAVLGVTIGALWLFSRLRRNRR